VNGIQRIAITKLDVLDEFEDIRICTGFKVNGKTLKHYPTDSQTLDIVEPSIRLFGGGGRRHPIFGVIKIAQGSEAVY